MDDHALAIDIVDLEKRCLCSAYAGRIKNNENRALQQRVNCVRSDFCQGFEDEAAVLHGGMGNE